MTPLYTSSVYAVTAFIKAIGLCGFGYVTFGWMIVPPSVVVGWAV